jgi:predicted metal-dependent peptidase
MTDENHGRKVRLAREVVELARGRIVADNQFLAPSIGLLDVREAKLGVPFSTDGKTLFIDADLVLADFARTRQPPVHDLAHVILHCLLMHPFLGGREGVDREAWSLATDIVVESLVQEMLGPRPNDRGRAIGIVCEQLEQDLGPAISTRTVYRALAGGAYQNMRDSWRAVLAVDDSTPWFPAPRQRRGQAEAQEDAAGQHSHAPGAGEQAGGGSPAPTHQGEGGAGKPQPGGEGGPGGRRAEQAPTRDGAGELDASLAPVSPLGAREREEAAARWLRAAKSARVDLETTSAARGHSLGNLLRELRVADHRRQDLREFLRKFARPREAMRISPDEFDYVFYSYGLRLYGNMPLIENLEYREQALIRDFAIVIDTSGSVDGPAVQRFVNVAYDALTGGGVFCDRVNVHLIQCDADVREDTKIAGAADLDRWRRGVELHGFGGTDFRPAFAYVDDLLARGEFTELAGLIYLTDGWGTYPERMPAYKTAFVFYDQNFRPDVVPPWAIQFVLDPDELGQRDNPAADPLYGRLSIEDLEQGAPGRGATGERR